MNSVRKGSHLINVSEAELRAIELRECGKTFREIGTGIGVCANRAMQIHARAIFKRDEWPKNPLYPLSVRAVNCLNNIAVTNKKEALSAIQSGRLKPLRSPRNYGWKTHQEICRWLGLPEPKRPGRKIAVSKTCPHCGGKLTRNFRVYKEVPATSE